MLMALDLTEELPMLTAQDSTKVSEVPMLTSPDPGEGMPTLAALDPTKGMAFLMAQDHPSKGMAFLTTPDPTVGPVEVGRRLVLAEDDLSLCPNYYVEEADHCHVMATGLGNAKLPTSPKDSSSHSALVLVEDGLNLCTNYHMGEGVLESCNGGLG